MKHCLIAFLSALIWVHASFAQPVVTVGASASHTGTTAYSTGNFAVSGSNVVLVACVYNVWGSGSQVTTGVTWNNSESFTPLVSQGTEPSDAGNISFWYLVDPTQITENVDIAITNSSTTITQVLIVTGAGSPDMTLSDSAGPEDPVSAQITTTAANTLLLTCGGNGASTDTFTYGTGQTEILEVNETGGSGITSATSKEVRATSGLETLSMDGASGQTIRFVAMGIPPFSAPAGGRRRGAHVIQ